MFKNHLKIALRNLLKHRFYTFINGLGLAVGLAAFLLIVFWVKDEWSYDKYNTKIDRMYRVTVDWGLTKPNQQMAYCPIFLAEKFKEIYPEIEEAVRIMDIGDHTINYNENNLKTDKVAYAGAGLFSIFSIPLVKGNPATALVAPNSLVIDESTAKRLFGEEDPLNKMVVLDNNENYKVTGVFEDIPATSHFKFNSFVSIENLLKQDWTKELTAHSVWTYLLLREQTDPKLLEAKFPQAIKTYLSGDILEMTGVPWEELKQNNLNYDWKLQAVKDIHLHSIVDGEKGDIIYVYAFSFIAVLILLIACINYINLATARSADRSKEIGVRKVAGAYRTQLVRQFLNESLLLSLIATLLAIGLVELFLPAFNQVTGKSIYVQYWGNWPLLISLLLCPLLLALLSGFYPAFLLSGFQPARVLKGKLNSGMKNTRFRNILVIIQFSISIFLTVSTLVLYQQINFIQNRDIGYAKNHLLIVEDTHLLGKQKESFKEELLHNPQFFSGTFTNYLPVDYFNQGTILKGNGQYNSFECSTLFVDYSYVSTLGMKMKDGRYFSPDFPSDASSVVLNESTIKKLGYEEPIGQTISAWGEEYTIIGVVKDFNYSSMRNRIKPAALFLKPNNGVLTLRIDGNSTKEAIALVKEQWAKMASGQPFSYSFMDEHFDKMYRKEQKTARVLSLFSGLAIFIASLGLFALAAFTSEQRKKEIGVRKVLGSTVPSIVLLLSKDFAKLILIAFVIASPIAWYVMNDWLEGFAYRTSIGVGVFLIAIGL
ncbi:ABC transporter permease, partial [Xanthovirga aplysinae]|uniref:ABC transporter permease n=1 Tax=Xanthovirga aplysinae TaxID=2529853 RepID=UPI0012BBF14D